MSGVFWFTASVWDKEIYGEGYISLHIVRSERGSISWRWATPYNIPVMYGAGGRYTNLVYVYADVGLGFFSSLRWKKRQAVGRQRKETRLINLPYILHLHGPTRPILLLFCPFTFNSSMIPILLPHIFLGS